MGSHLLLQEIFLTQGLDPSVMHWQTYSVPLSHRGNSVYICVYTYGYNSFRKILFLKRALKYLTINSNRKTFLDLYSTLMHFHIFFLVFFAAQSRKFTNKGYHSLFGRVGKRLREVISFVLQRQLHSKVLIQRHLTMYIATPFLNLLYSVIGKMISPQI